MKEKEEGKKWPFLSGKIYGCKGISVLGIELDDFLGEQED